MPPQLSLREAASISAALAVEPSTSTTTGTPRVAPPPPPLAGEGQGDHCQREATASASRAILVPGGRRSDAVSSPSWRFPPLLCRRSRIISSTPASRSLVSPSRTSLAVPPTKDGMRRVPERWGIPPPARLRAVRTRTPEEEERSAPPPSLWAGVDVGVPEAVPAVPVRIPIRSCARSRGTPPALPGAKRRVRAARASGGRYLEYLSNPPRMSLAAALLASSGLLRASGSRDCFF
mmetsp:Transcript_32172/g.78371  ORF Transcript_32172/g.78371 Transcript_32172/m.78371 type:complete len:235 (+) Transcript_32172:384-1088(+)